jgi:RNA polymerase sigma-70 factor (ECF subfamily)
LDSPFGDEQLLARLRSGDAAAYEALVRMWGPPLLTVARRFLHQEQDSQDAVQETFLSAFRALDRFQGEARLGTWLYRIAVNVCLMKLRSRRRRPELAIEDLLPRFHNDGHRDLAVLHPSGLDLAVDQREVRQQVRQAIEALPDSYREVLILRDIEQLSTEETALQLEIGEGAVKTRLHRARLALRELLVPYVQGDAT